MLMLLVSVELLKRGQKEERKGKNHTWIPMPMRDFGQCVLLEQPKHQFQGNQAEQERNSKENSSDGS
jgi:hypothetical protein